MGRRLNQRDRIIHSLRLKKREEGLSHAIEKKSDGIGNRNLAETEPGFEGTASNLRRTNRNKYLILKPS
jgi:hypothetical protein